MKGTARFQKIVTSLVLKKLRQQGADRSPAARDAIKAACKLQSVRRKGSGSMSSFNLPKCQWYDGVEEFQPRIFRRAGNHREVTGAVIALFASEDFEWEGEKVD